MKRAQRVGRYHMMDCIGSGGMAEVYRAKCVDDDGSERLVALKRVLEMYADDQAFIRMLVAEYQLASLLVHPNIAQVYELLRVPEGYFVVMEYIDGKDLRSTLLRGHDRGRKMDVADAVYLMARAVDGLSSAHAAETPDGRALQLVHRDFSPSNILLGYEGSVKVIDFGIAKANVDRDRTAVGIIKGKVRYMSPEQANGDRGLTGQSDVFSAGSVLYEMLSGQSAFQAQSEIELIYAVRKAEPPPLRTLVPDIPQALATVVETAMARLRRDRYPSAGDFRDALVTFLRAYAPGYRRTHLANHMRTLWEREIDQEIRALLEYAISDAPVAASENLLESASLEQSLRDAQAALGADDLFAAEILGRFASEPRAAPKPTPPPRRARTRS